MECAKKLISKYCDGQDLRLVNIHAKKNKRYCTHAFMTRAVLMCAACRKANHGAFRYAAVEERKKPISDKALKGKIDAAIKELSKKMEWDYEPSRSD